MPSDSDKKIRSIKDNPAGKVVSEGGGGNRWEWDSDDPTSLLLKRLANDELAIEQTGIRKSEEPESSGPVFDKRGALDAPARGGGDPRHTRGEQDRARATSAGRPGSTPARGGTDRPAARNDFGKPRGGGRDSGGGFNPYDSSGKSRKR
jgi:hypothetical protein